MKYPTKVLHWIEDREIISASGEYLEKVSPATGKVMTKIVKGNKEDVETAVNIAVKSFEIWSNNSVINRANLLRKATILMQNKREEIAQIVSAETGKSIKDALSEVDGAIELGFFMAGEGRRFYGKTTTSTMDNRMAMTIRQPVGVCALIIPFNTPIANVAWKAFPTLLCGNTAVLKAASDTPYTSLWFGKILKEAGLPAGVFNVIQGSGEEVGKVLIEDERINLISFTGSVETGRFIQKIAGSRLVKISLELGGKNPLVVCDDADLEKACHFAILSAFSNAGQRCASGSRIIIFKSVYNEFKKLFVSKAKKLKIGSKDSDDLGPVINEEQLKKILATVDKTVKSDRAKILTGGNRLTDLLHRNGYYIVPTIIENISPEAKISQMELFGPVTCLYKVKDFDEAINLANNSSYGLTAAIHTQSIHRIQEFTKRIRAGVVSINGPTYGSEPHLPFGGLKNSGNGSREPGTEALDVYSEWKTVYIKHDPSQI